MRIFADKRKLVNVNAITFFYFKVKRRKGANESNLISTLLETKVSYAAAGGYVP